MEYGGKELEIFNQQFGKLLEHKNVDIASLSGEWTQLKLFWENSMSHLKYNDVWKAVLTAHAEKFPNMTHVIQILKLYPVSNAKVERGFSALGRIKTDWRCRLKTSVLDSLLRIDLEGPSIECFDSSFLVKKFFSKRRHPNVEPYGPRQSKQKLQDEASFVHDSDI